MSESGGTSPASLTPGHQIALTAQDGHVLDAWCAEPAGSARWSAVILQEIFGVNAHIREVCARFAALGAATVSPALFDRVRRGVELGYDRDAIETGRALRAEIGWEAAVADMRAAVDHAAGVGPVAVIGFCWGGTLAFLAATRLPNVACTVSYYGGQTAPFAAERVRVPVLMHFGSQDPRIPAADRQEILGSNPEIEAHLYPADHGFNCDHRKEWHAPSAALAMERTLAFLARHLGAGHLDIPNPA